jgi:hypothetical protein
MGGHSAREADDPFPARSAGGRSENIRLGDLLLADDVPDGAAGRKLRAVARHLLDYRTRRSLAVDQELGDADAVEIGIRWLTNPAD